MPNKHERWYKLYMDGASFTEIADAAGTSKGAVSGAIKRYRDANGLPGRKSPAKPVRPPRARPTPAAVTHTNPPISLADATEKSCLFPVGTNGPTLFCGAQRADGRPYCTEHCERAYLKPRKRAA